MNKKRMRYDFHVYCAYCGAYFSQGESVPYKTVRKYLSRCRNYGWRVDPDGSIVCGKCNELDCVGDMYVTAELIVVKKYLITPRLKIKLNHAL